MGLYVGLQLKSKLLSGIFNGLAVFSLLSRFCTNQNSKSGLT